jgi:hypothetical protein
LSQGISYSYDRAIAQIYGSLPPAFFRKRILPLAESAAARGLENFEASAAVRDEACFHTERNGQYGTR